ncbi:Ribosome biogenesis ATPase rix7 [Sorochytrium milnesiophthora]
MTTAIYKKVDSWVRRLTVELNTRDEKVLVAEMIRLDPHLKRQKKKLVDEALRTAMSSLRTSDSRSDGNSSSSSDDNEQDADDVVDDAALYAPHQKFNRLNRSLTAMYASKKPEEAASAQGAEAVVTTAPVTTVFPPPMSPTRETAPVDPATPTQSQSQDGTATPKDKRKASTSSTAGAKGTKKRKTAERPRSSAPEPEPAAGDADTFSFSVPKARLSDLGGVEKCIESILELVAMPLLHPEVYVHIGVSPPRGILLHGPPGCGKTLLANAIAGELGVPFMNISAPSIVSGMSGESEKKIREIFDEARRVAPCLIFLDEIDAITPKRESAQREMERRIVAQLLTCIDELSFENTNHKAVMVLGATNRPDSIDSALRRAGRFDREIGMTVPDQASRVKILKVLSAKLQLAGDFDFEQLAKLTPGYVGADLSALTAEAGLIAVKRIFETLGQQHTKGTEDGMDVDAAPSDHLPSLSVFGDAVIAQFLQKHPSALSDTELAPLAITVDDFALALEKVQPSSKREGFATVPGVTWEQIGALNYVRDELRMAVVEPVRHPEFFSKVGIDSPSGVLLWGPPGCGKTLLAKAVANESHSNFISVKGPELLNKYVGESERAVRRVFARARASAPCVIFFDEIDALVPRRDDAKSEASSRVVNTLLTELDGLESRKQVFIIAATNRPDIIDPAMIRPGRLDKLLYVELPTADERVEILRTVCTRTPLASGTDMNLIGRHPKCDGFSGADLAALVREASVSALRSTFDRLKTAGAQDAVGASEQISVSMDHFDMAFTKVFPSVSKKEKRAYDVLKTKFFSNTIKSVGENVLDKGEDKDAATPAT